MAEFESFGKWHDRSFTFKMTHRLRRLGSYSDYVLKVLIVRVLGTVNFVIC